MARFFLKNPENPTDDHDILVQKGQSWDEPIYQAARTGSFFILKWGTDFTRVLVSYDPSTGTIGSTAYAVPPSWSGEPRVVGIDEDLWADLPTLSTSDLNAERLLQQLLQDLLEGDILRLMRGHQPVGFVRYEFKDGHWNLVTRTV